MSTIDLVAADVQIAAGQTATADIEVAVVGIRPLAEVSKIHSIQDQ